MRLRRLVSIAAVALLVGSAACHRPARDNEVDTATLLPRLAAAAPTAQLALLEALSSVHPDRRDARWATLTAAVQPLLDARDPAVAAKAGELLAHWGEHAATSGLVRLLQHADPMILLSAASSLAALADPATAAAVARATHDPQAAVRVAACAALGALGPAAPLEPLQAGLGDPDAAASSAIGRRGQRDAAALLLPLLQYPQPGVADAVLRALAGVGDRDVVGAIVPLLSNGSQGRRAAAAAALGQLGDRAAVAPLLQLLRADDAVLRLASLNALGLLRDPAAVDAVLSLAEEPEPRVAERVPYVLAHLYTSDRIEEWRSRLHDANPDVRAAVALALGLADEQRAGGDLIQVLADPVPRVRGAAAETVGLLGTADARVVVEQLAEHEPDPEGREAVTIGAALAHASPRGVVPRLIVTLGDPNPRVRMFAAHALGRLARADAADALQGAEQHDEDSEVRAAAHLALLRMNGLDV